MKKTSLITIALLATLTGKAFAQKSSSLPQIPAPRELTEVGSEFAEGTITRLSEREASVFLPWAQNAQSVLTKALRDIETMTVQQQVRHLTAIMKSVVTNSGSKNYQMFMRFALNRTLLLVQELTLQSDWNVPGTAESVLDLQISGINLALEFYESDLSYQTRAAEGNDSVNQPYAYFGTTFGTKIIRSIQNITDASAQYRVLYKTLEMINWDFSRDALAVEFSDSIVEIYNTLNTLDEQPVNIDSDNVLAIRRLSVLVNSVNQVKKSLSSYTERVRAENQRRANQERADIARRNIETYLRSGIVVIADNVLFTITGVDELDAHNDCLAKFPGTRTDNLLIARGNRKPQYFYNSGSYWSAYDACLKVIRSELSTESSRTSYNYYGLIEDKSYQFTGSSAVEVLYQCHNFVLEHGINKADDISIGSNGKVPEKYYNSGSYWHGSVGICNMILEKVM